jgi:hypothetical protein
MNWNLGAVDLNIAQQHGFDNNGGCDYGISVVAMLMC